MTLLIAFLIISLTLLIFPPKIPRGVLLCTLTPISAANCRNEGGAGIAEVYGISFSEIDSVTWDSSNEEATAITLTGGATWTQYEPEPDTAFFNQDKQLVGQSNLNFVQTLSMNFTNNNVATRQSLRELDSCCDLVFIIVDNQNQQRLMGIQPKYNSAGDTIIGSTSLRLETGAGSYNTGADSAADENVRTVTVAGNSPKEAPYTSVDVTALALT